MEVVARVSGRRKWTSEEKLEILRDAFGPGGSVREAIELHEVYSGLLYTWRRQAVAGTLNGSVKPVLPSFAEVCVAELPMLPSSAGGVIGIELPSGIKLSVDWTAHDDWSGCVVI
jgi:transposase